MKMKAAMKMRTISHKRFLTALMFPLHIRFLRYGYAVVSAAHKNR